MLFQYPEIYLASASPRRHEILLQMQVPHTVLQVPSPPGEDEPRLPGEAPADYVRRTAMDKAQRALAWLRANALEPRPILAADTTVILGNDILGKPDGPADAASMLARLSGTAHEVHTAIVLALPAGWLRNGVCAEEDRLLDDVSITQVHFKHLNPREIARYCDSGEPYGKAGSYGIQGLAGAFIEHIAGSYSGVMGLPVFETARLLDTI